jgi:hypothetical protein
LKFHFKDTRCTPRAFDSCCVLKEKEHNK